jgi:DNA (cytosine-5)-methyltransferase 1
MNELVLSLFPGIGLLDRAFEEEGYCIVRGPDVLWGGDIRRFHPPAGVFAGVIGGPPCQPFSQLVHIVRANGYEPRHGNLIPEFERVVAEAQPDWFIMEEVPAASLPSVAGYIVRDLVLNNRWVGGTQNRERRFSFGTRDGRRLLPDVVAFEPAEWDFAVVADARRRPERPAAGGKLKGTGKFSATSSLNRNLGGEVPHQGAMLSVAEMCRLQGLPEDFIAESPFTVSAKRRMIGNGVPLPLGRAIAKAVRQATC